MAMPGQVTTQWLTRQNCWAELSIAPHSGVGGWAPIPRKERPAAERIAPASERVTWTMIGPIELGMMCRNMTRPCLEPAAMAALTKSISRTLITAERTMRAKIGTLEIPTAIITFVMPGPRAATIASARRKADRKSVV